MAPFQLGESAQALYQLRAQVDALRDRIILASEAERRSGEDRRTGFRANTDRRLAMKLANVA
jgi:hypothetical protein